jgi:hypothetical protein
MKEYEAKIIQPQYKDVIARLEQGEVLLITEGKEEPVVVSVPELSRRDCQRIAASIERDPLEELAEMEDVDPDDSRYGDDDEEDLPPVAEKVIPIGRDNRTKQEVGIPKQTFDMLVRMRKANNTQVSGYRGIQELLDCTETHARNINKLIDDACETGRVSEREG